MNLKIGDMLLTLSSLDIAKGLVDLNIRLGTGKSLLAIDIKIDKNDSAPFKMDLRIIDLQTAEKELGNNAT